MGNSQAVKKQRDNINSLTSVLGQYKFPIIIICIGFTIAIIGFVLSLRYNLERLEHDFEINSKSDYNKINNYFNSYLRVKNTLYEISKLYPELFKEENNDYLSPLFKDSRFAAFAYGYIDEDKEVNTSMITSDISEKNEQKINNSNHVEDLIKKALRERELVIGDVFSIKNNKDKFLAIAFPILSESRNRVILGILNISEFFEKNLIFRDNESKPNIFLFNENNKLVYNSAKENTLNYNELSYDQIIQTSYFSFTRDMKLLDKDWKIIIIPDSSYLVNAVSILPWLILLLIIIITMLLSFFVFSLVTSNIRINSLVNKRTEALRNSNEELEKFAYVASHDLKAPLRAVDQLANWISEDIKNDNYEDIEFNLNMMQQRVSRMKSLLDDLLAYSRVNKDIYKENVPVVNGAKILEDLKLLLNKPDNFVIEADEKFKNILIKKAPLEQVLLNLVSNSIKHHDKDKGHAKISVSEKKDRYIFSVSDDGPGIDKKYHERAFEMFQTLRPRDEVEGSGMGLAMVKKIINNLGGEIKINSEVGKGTEFIFDWPKK